MKEVSVSYHNYDIIFKSLTSMFGNQTLKFYGLETAPIVRAEPTELPQIQIEENRLDFVFYLADDTFLHLEFQTTYSIEDLERFKLYDALLYEKKKKPVITAVIYGAGITNTITSLNHGSIAYNTYAVYMHNYDGDDIYKGLGEKINKGLTLEVTDRLNLIFLPLMRNSVDKSERAIDALELARKVPDEKEQLFLIGCLVGISDKFIDKDYVSKMMEVLKMTQVLQALYKEFKEEGRAEGKAEGRAEGRAEGEIDAICKFLKTKFGLSSLALQKKLQKLVDRDLIDGITEKLFTISSMEEAGAIIEEAIKIQKEIQSMD